MNGVVSTGGEGAVLPPLVVICGATATGKTSLSLELAERLGDTEIVSADSRQVYRGMDVGTAKPTFEARARIPHHGLDLVAPDEPFSVARYRAAALEALRGIAARGRLALLVGGTGLYLRAVARGMELDAGSSDAELRAELEQRLTVEGLPALVDELRRLAPRLAASVDVANPRRVVRALERARLIGDEPPPPPRGYPAPSAWIGTTVEPAAHRQAIGRRASDQFAHGLIDEARALRERYDPEARAFSAVGYREAFGVLDGELTLERALARTITRTWQYGRRQGTWFRREEGVTWLPVERARDEALAIARSLVAS